MSNNQSLNGLARRLVQDGILNMEDAKKCSLAANRSGIPFVKYVVEKRIVASKVVAVAASQEFGIPVLDLDAFSLEVIPKDLVKTELLQKHNALHLIKRGSRLSVAVSDPTNLPALDEIKFQTGLNTEPILVEQDKLAKYIDEFINADSANSMMNELEDEGLDNIDISSVDDEPGDSEDDVAADSAPIVRFINKVLLDAIKTGASDIHFEPYEKMYRIRFRTDGILETKASPPLQQANRISARLKVMSKMDISERRIPQDGRIKMKISNNRAIDFRVNTLPTIWGEKIVLRILDPSSAKMGIDALGYEEDQKALYLEALHKPQGMVLVTGPTGSGKTVSLYTGLNILNTNERNIATAEDPVEINLEGINQVNVQAKIGLDFSTSLRAFLRQDPDVVMVGEIRDLETAEIAIKAAQTGHMVMSTLHTNSAPETLTRLANMGVPAFNLATSVVLIIAQRLARKLCNDCKVQIEVPKNTLLEEGFLESDIDEGIEIYEASAEGCSQCNAGFKGRVGIYEVVKITPEISKIIMAGGSSLELAQMSEKLGFYNLRVAALKKVKKGLTSLVEANRVTSN